MSDSTFFVPVRSLLTARRDDLLQLLIDHLVGDLLLGALHHVEHLGGLGAGAGRVLLGRGLALANSLEAVVVVIGGGLRLAPSSSESESESDISSSVDSIFSRAAATPAAMTDRPSGACGASA